MAVSMELTKPKSPMGSVCDPESKEKERNLLLSDCPSKLSSEIRMAHGPEGVCAGQLGDR